MRIRTLNDRMKPTLPSSLAEWEEKRVDILENLKFASSIELLKHSTPLSAHVYPAAEYEGFVVETAFIQTLPGFWLVGNIYRPKDLTKKYPAVLNPHGHWDKGRIDMQEISTLPVRFANLALRGMVVFAYDMIGYNDTNQIAHKGFNPEYEDYNYGRFSLQLNNSIKAVDFVSSLPYVNADKIGCTGCSGGGTQTYFLSAIDKRIKAAAPINMASYVMQGGCVCENTAFLRTDYNNMDYTMLTAPRPLFMAASDGDWTRLSETLEFPTMAKLYELYKAEENYKSFFRSAPHCFEKCTREKVYDFFCKVFEIDNPYDSEIEVEIDTSKLVRNGVPDFFSKVKDEAELFEVAKKLINTNLAKLSQEERENIVKRVFALSHDFELDIPYIIDEATDEVKIVLGKCPERADTCEADYFHCYNYAEDTKRVNAIAKLCQKYPDVKVYAKGKSAALLEISKRITNSDNVVAEEPDYSDVVIPGIKLI